MHGLLGDARFYRALLEIDSREVEGLHGALCPHCGSRLLHTVDYPRRPRGVPAGARDRSVLYTTQEEAREEALNRLLVWRVARQIRIDRRLPEGEVVRVTLHNRDGRMLFEGEAG